MSLYSANQAISCKFPSKTIPHDVFKPFTPSETDNAPRKPVLLPQSRTNFPQSLFTAPPHRPKLLANSGAAFPEETPVLPRTALLEKTLGHNVKTKRIIAIVAVGLSATALIVVACQKDARLVGTYVPDVKATHSRWELGKSISEDGMSNVLTHIFQSQPMVMTERHMIIAAEHGQVTKRYVVIWKGAHRCIIGMSHLEIFRIDFTDDGAWFAKTGLLPQRPYPMILKMQRIPQQSPPQKSH